MCKIPADIKKNFEYTTAYIEMENRPFSNVSQMTDMTGLEISSKFPNKICGRNDVRERLFFTHIKMRTANWPTVYPISPPAQSYMKVMASSSILMGHQRRHREHTSIKHLSGNWWLCCGLNQSLFGCLLHTLLQQSTSHWQHAQKESPELSQFLLRKLVCSCYVPAAAPKYWIDLHQPEHPKGQQERFCSNTTSQQWFIITLHLWVWTVKCAAWQSKCALLFCSVFNVSRWSICRSYFWKNSVHPLELTTEVF